MLMRRLLRSMMRPGRGPTARVCALLAAVALLTPSIAAFSGPDGLGWLPDHGHVFLDASAAAHPHTHPWDERGTPAPRFEGGASLPGGAAPVIFTAGERGATDAAGSVTLPAVSPLPAVAWLTRAVEMTPAVLSGLVLPPLDPPPQRA